MHVVAIHRLQGPADQLAQQLAAVLGCTPYEARSRVIAPQGGPAVVGAFADRTAAADCAARLAAAGFAPLVLDAAAAVEEERFVAYQVVFEPTGLTATTRGGPTATWPYREVTLLLRATAFSSTTQSETTREKKFSAGRALLSGGLVMNKTVKTVNETTTQHRYPFLQVYAPSRPPLVLNPEQMDFSTLGDARQLSREANFGWICAELRRRCPGARWDDRLQARPGQAQLLGPALSPELHLELAMALLARAGEEFQR